MPEDKENRAALKILASTHSLLLDEQNRRRKLSGVKYPIQSLIAEAVKRLVAVPDSSLSQSLPAELLAHGKPIPKSAEAQYPEGHRDYHRKLQEILGSGDQATIDAVAQNIDVFHERLRPAPHPKRKTG